MEVVRKDGESIEDYMYRRFAKTGEPIPSAAVFIIKDDKVLLGKRMYGAGAGQYGLPGGHVEDEETHLEALKRETLEEAGVEIKDVNLLIEKEETIDGKTYSTQFFSAVINGDDEPENLEPDFCESWNWYPIDDLPSPLFGPLDEYIKLIHEDEQQ